MPGELILIVDDNPANVRLVSFLLGARGYEVRTASNAEEARAVVRAARPRLILMDIQLPGTDGLTLTRELRADPPLGDVLIVAVTAYAMVGDEQKALDAGCDGYITKPIDTRALPRTIAEYLSRPQPPRREP
jgi:CheY-like chemotaxis protein